MDNNYFGGSNMRNERGSGSSSSSSSSSRKGKKNIQDKPKQPQRGLGVAQLEKIRIHDQMATSYHLHQHGPFPSNFNNEDPIVQTPYSSIPTSFSFSSSSTSYSASYGFQSNFVMGLSEHERANMRYGDSHPTNTTRREHAILETQSSAQPSTRPLLILHDSHQHVDTKKHRSGGSVGSSNQNSETSDTQEPDLELRLSL
ncbi:PREDICTED: protein SPEAR1-like [Lupinus angustifolius]|uniref:protein SPEAR1-like n=1 Tax=Lupinus angustifolius TaxID=3871 RepID=UPI00092F5127|nr:PREDICTED: protein SPEAR1-like [Lupinus angustifolius]